METIKEISRNIAYIHVLHCNFTLNDLSNLIIDIVRYFQQFQYSIKHVFIQFIL